MQTKEKWYIYVESFLLRWGWWWLCSEISNWRKVSRISIPAWSISSVQPPWYRVRNVFFKCITMMTIHIYVYHHHHHVMPQARISLTLSRHFSLTFIASGWSSGLHFVSSHSYCMYVRAGHPAFARPYVGVHRSTSLLSSSLLLQQCPACLDSFRDGRQVAV